MAGMVKKEPDFELQLDVLTSLQPVTLGAQSFTKAQFDDICDALFTACDTYYGERRTLTYQINMAQSLAELEAIIIAF